MLTVSVNLIEAREVLARLFIIFENSVEFDEIDVMI
jgi:hypothetical protein